MFSADNYYDLIFTKKDLTRLISVNPNWEVDFWGTLTLEQQLTVIYSDKTDKCFLAQLANTHPTVLKALTDSSYDEEVVLAVASNAKTDQTTLTDLSTHYSVNIRKAVFMNPSTPLNTVVSLFSFEDNMWELNFREMTTAVFNAITYISDDTLNEFLYVSFTAIYNGRPEAVAARTAAITEFRKRNPIFEDETSYPTTWVVRAFSTERKQYYPLPF